MAKYSHKMKGKEVGQADVYAPPHDMTGKDITPAHAEGAGYPETDVKTSGIKVRGTGAATKGLMARGPMA
jgi:hypothetical protein